MRRLGKGEAQWRDDFLPVPRRGEAEFKEVVYVPLGES